MMTESISQSNKKFFIYLRQSKKDNSNHTFDVQLKTIQQFAHQRWIFIDTSDNLLKQEDASAYEWARKKFEEMIAELINDSKRPYEKRIYAGILFFNVSRIARNSEDFLVIEQLMKQGYRMLSATENIIDSASGMYFFRMIQIESIYYSDRQSSKSQSYNLHILSKNSRKAIGWNGTTYWYDVRNGEICIHPVNSLLVKRIFELREKGKSNEAIAEMLICEFAATVEEYNNPQKKKKGLILDSSEDVEDMNLYDDEEERILDIFVPATIPSAKKISDILSWRWSIQYNWKRRCKFSIGFEEDVTMYNHFLDSRTFSFEFESSEIQWFRKGDNVIILNVPELRIIDNNEFEDISKSRISKERTEGWHLYNGIAFCVCWWKMMGKIEGRLGNVYYQCENSKKQKENACKNTTRILESEISLFIQNRIFPYFGLKEGSKEYINCVKDLQVIKTEHLIDRIKTEKGNLSKFKTMQSSAKNAKIHEEYTNKIKEKSDVIELLQSEIENIKAQCEIDFARFIQNIEEFWQIERKEQNTLIHNIFEHIIMEEDHTDEFRYDNKYNRKSIQYQKITSFELTPYFQALFDMNFSCDPI